MKPRILVVDDEPGTVRIVREQLEVSGFEVSVATDGEAGLTMAREIAPDLVVLDIMMPTMSGCQVCARLKADSALRRIPVVVLTARAQRQAYRESMQHGAEGYLTKPFEMEELLGTIRDLLQRAAGRGSGEQAAG